MVWEGELHKFLEVDTKFTMWIERMLEYGFEEGRDFIPILGKSTGGRPSTDYALIACCVKELSMLQRKEKGQRFWLYKPFPMANSFCRAGQNSQMRQLPH